MESYGLHLNLLAIGGDFPPFNTFRRESQAIVNLGGTAKEFLGRSDLASEMSMHMAEDAKAEF